MFKDSEVKVVTMLGRKRNFSMDWSTETLGSQRDGAGGLRGRACGAVGQG